MEQFVRDHIIHVGHQCHSALHWHKAEAHTPSPPWWTTSSINQCFSFAETRHEMMPSFRSIIHFCYTHIGIPSTARTLVSLLVTLLRKNGGHTRHQNSTLEYIDILGVNTHGCDICMHPTSQRGSLEG